MTSHYYLRSLSHDYRSIEGPFSPGTSMIIGRDNVKSFDRRKRTSCSHAQLRLTVTEEGKVYVRRLKGTLNPTVVNIGSDRECILEEDEEVEVQVGDVIALASNKFHFMLEMMDNKADREVDTTPVRSIDAVNKGTGNDSNKKRKGDVVSSSQLESVKSSKKCKLIFSGMKIYVAIRGQLTKGIKQILETQVKERGGQIVNDINECSIIVIDTSLQPDIILDTLKVKSVPDIYT